MLSLWDTHIHSEFSGDSSAPLGQMIAAARAKGLRGICFTDHLDLDYPGDPKLFLLDLPAYWAAMKARKERPSGAFSLRSGVELGLQPHLASAHAAILSEYPFDFVIGSSHVVHGIDPYDPPYWENRSREEAYREYFISILENVRAFDGFDVYGHLDYVARYGPGGGTPYSFRQYADIIDEILRLLIDKGKGIELNTGGLKCGPGCLNPSEDILIRYRELGGEIITLGSDAHAPEHVAFAFEKVPGILKNAGFSYYTVFQERKPVFLKLA